ncbi:MAG: hypothetical protein ACRC8Q_01885, partial [Aeromonas sp.]
LFMKVGRRGRSWLGKMKLRLREFMGFLKEGVKKGVKRGVTKGKARGKSGGAKRANKKIPALSQR